MDEQLVKLFNFNNLKINKNIFKYAEIIKVEFSLSKKIYIVYIKVLNLIPISLLKEIEILFFNNSQLPTKLIWIISDLTYNLNDIIKYINYIQQYQLKFKYSNFYKLEKNNLKLEKTILFINVYSESEQKMLLDNIQYYEKTLQNYGFNKLKIKINICKNKNILKINHNNKNINFNTINFNNPTIIKIININNINNSIFNVILHGKIFDKNCFFTKNKKYIYNIMITDLSDSILAKYFTKDDKPNLFIENLKLEQWISIYGDICYDKFIKENIILIKKINLIDEKTKNRIDNAEQKRIELHTHTKMSVMDGLINIKDLFKTLSLWGHKAIAFTDHNNIQAFPEIYNISLQYPNIKVIYGVEIDFLYDKIWYVKNPYNINLINSKYVIFDLETTGLSSEYDEIIEFGAVIMNGINNKKIVVNHLFKSSKKISNFITELTGITDELLINKPSFVECIDIILKYFQNAILIAHNADFDIGFIQSWIQKAGYPKINNTIIDTLQISRILIPNLKNYKLKTVAKYYNIQYDKNLSHRGAYDANILADIYKCQLTEMMNNFDITFDIDINKIHNIDIYKKIKSYHLTILAKNQQGIFDLFYLITLANTKYFYLSPKLFKNTIMNYRKNLLIGSSCVYGDIFEFAKNKTLKQLEKAMNFYDYVEINPLNVYKHLIQLKDLTEERLLNVIKNIINIAKKLNKLIIASGNVHYLEPTDKILREIYINSKGIGGKRHPLYDYKGRIIDFPDQYLRTTKEMLKEFDFLNDTNLINEIVIINPNKINNQIQQVEIIKNKIYIPIIKNSKEKLRNLCYTNVYKKYGQILPKIVEQRLEKELFIINKYNFSSIFWITYKLVNQSIKDGYLVGSRGSVGSSFVAKIINITEVNPLPPHYLCEKCHFIDFNIENNIKCGFDLKSKYCPQCTNLLIGDGHNIPFEIFLGFNVNKIPDIDLNFSSEYQSLAHNFIKNMFGEKNVYRAGTISTVAEKTAYGYVKNYFELKNIFHLKRKCEIQRMIKGCEGVKKTTGQHPGGIIIIPNNYKIEDFTPVNYPADDINSNWLTTHFEFNAISKNIFKLDILGHADPTALKMLFDLTNINPKNIPTNDLKVMSLFNICNIKLLDNNNIKIGVIGIPEFGTEFARKILIKIKPSSFSDLVKISGLSHGTNVWNENAQELVQNKGLLISNVISCRDDIFNDLVLKGLSTKIAFKIMEDVRRGKGLNQKYINLMKQYNIEEWYINSCSKIKYMFPKAHAVAYVLMAWRIAWFKIYYPIEYYATYFTTKTNVFDIKTILKGSSFVHEVLKNIKKRMNMKNFLNTNFKVTQKEKDLIPLYEIILEMYNRGIKIVNIDLAKSQNTKFIIIYDKNNQKVILPPFLSIDGFGETVGDSIIKARNSKFFTSIEDLKKRTILTKTHIKTLEELGILNNFLWNIKNNI